MKVNFLTQLNEFITYCNDFYNNEIGIYPIATSAEIEEAVGEYMRITRDITIEFDSIDRENVRIIIEQKQAENC